MSGERTELETLTVSEKGQLAIPVDIRRKLNIKKGDKLLIVVHGNKMMLEKSDAISDRVKEDFGHLLKLSENTAKKLWDNDKDAVWDNV
ncbi:MAG: AbrB/MazE/SpoVT family DNA-binding domain-containing protein [Thaumarchaeota archaeon]|nr:AbrB/MazE/SpoVT family DNA-binding domain-containing protein [Nitrososphaerota archaeon]